MKRRSIRDSTASPTPTNNTRHTTTRTTHTLAAHLPGYDPGRRVIIANLGRSLNDILFDFAAAAGVNDPAAMSRTMLHTYRSFQRVNMDRLIRPYDGMREALAGLRDRGLTLG